MKPTALPTLVIVAGILITFKLGGLFGTAIAVTTMLGLAGMIVALDAFGPVTDNAGGIAEMAGLPKEVRKATDALDAVGNTTKAVTKGYAIGSAGLGALVLFAAYNYDLKYFIAEANKAGSTQFPYFKGVTPDFGLDNPYVVVGLLLGGLIPYLFGGIAMTAVGNAAGAIVEEVRRQFKAKPGIMKGTEKPDYGESRRPADRRGDQGNDHPVAAAGAVADRALLRDLLHRGRWCGSASRRRFSAVGAMLLGVIVTGIFVAISMTSGGGAWDNAKKSFEDGFRDKDGKSSPEGQRRAQGVRHRRHRRRPVQGHRRPRRQPGDQDHATSWPCCCWRCSRIEPRGGRLSVGVSARANKKRPGSNPGPFCVRAHAVTIC